MAPGTGHLHPQPSVTLVAPLNWADPGGNSPRRGEQGRWMVPSGSCSSSLGSPSSSFAPRARQPPRKEPRFWVLLLPARSSPPGSARVTAVFLALEVPGGHAGNKERQPAPQPPVISRPSSILPPRPPFPSRTQAQLLCHPQPCRHHAGSSLSPIPFPSVPGGRPAVLLLFLFPPALPDAASPRHQGPLSAGTARAKPGSCPGSHPGRAGSQHVPVLPVPLPLLHASCCRPKAVFLLCSHRGESLKCGVGHGDGDGLRTAKSWGLEMLQAAAPQPSHAPEPSVIIPLTSL